MHLPPVLRQIPQESFVFQNNIAPHFFVKPEAAAQKGDQIKNLRRIFWKYMKNYLPYLYISYLREAVIETYHMGRKDTLPVLQEPRLQEEYSHWQSPLILSSLPILY